MQVHSAHSPSTQMGLAVILALQALECGKQYNCNYNRGTVYIFQCFHAAVGTAIDFSLALFVVSISALNSYHKLLFYTPCLCSNMAISRFCAAWGCCNPRKNCPCTVQLDVSPGLVRARRALLGQTLSGQWGTHPPHCGGGLRMLF